MMYRVILFFTLIVSLSIQGGDFRNKAELEKVLENSQKYLDCIAGTGERHYIPTPLRVACRRGQLQVADNLIQNGADVNEIDDMGNTILYELCESEHTGKAELIKMLIANGADIARPNFILLTPWHIACERGDLDIVRLFIQSGIDINLIGGLSFDCTALSLACNNENKNLVMFLVEQGADVNLKNPLGRACLREDESIVAFLIEHGADVNDHTDPLGTACTFSQAPVVKVLLENGAGVDGISGDSLLHNVCNRSDRADKVVPLLLKYKANIHAKDSKGCTPLHIACWRGHRNMAESLLNHGAAVNEKDENEDTPLHHACQGSHYFRTSEDRVKKRYKHLVKPLIANGANVIAQNKNGVIPYDMAPAEIKALLEIKLKNEQLALSQNRLVAPHPPSRK